MVFITEHHSSNYNHKTPRGFKAVLLHNLRIPLDLLVLASAFAFANAIQRNGEGFRIILELLFSKPSVDQETFLFFQQIIEKMPFVILVQLCLGLLTKAQFLRWRNIQPKDITCFMVSAFGSAVLLLTPHAEPWGLLENFRIPVEIIFFDTVFVYAGLLTIRFSYSAYWGASSSVVSPDPLLDSEGRKEHVEALGTAPDSHLDGWDHKVGMERTYFLFDEVIYFQSNGHTIKAHLEHEIRSITFPGGLEKLAENLDPRKFMQIHRGCIVQIRHIRSYFKFEQKPYYRLHNHQQLLIGKKYHKSPKDLRRKLQIAWRASYFTPHPDTSPPPKPPEPH